MRAVSTGDYGSVDTIIRVPVTYGNEAVYCPDDADVRTQKHTHRWTVYFKTALPCESQENSPLQHIVKQVVFRLHNSYKNPIRRVTKPPYQVTESGWGEFEIEIHVEFRQGFRLADVDVIHYLRLFSDDIKMFGQECFSKYEVLDELVLGGSQNEQIMRWYEEHVRPFVGKDGQAISSGVDHLKDVISKVEKAKAMVEKEGLVLRKRILDTQAQMEQLVRLKPRELDRFIEQNGVYGLNKRRSKQGYRKRTVSKEDSILSSVEKMDEKARKNKRQCTLRSIDELSENSDEDADYSVTLDGAKELGDC